MVKITLTIENKHSYQIPANDDIKQAILRVLKEKGLSGSFEIDIKTIGKDEIRKLNKKYRSIDKPTDVLSFPIYEEVPKDSKTPILLGDIIICPEMAEVSIEKLIKHAALHLLGFHHASD